MAQGAVKGSGLCRHLGGEARAFLVGRAVLAVVRGEPVRAAQLTLVAQEKMLNGGAGPLPRVSIAGAQLGHGAMQHLLGQAP